MRCLRRWGLSDRIVERYVSEQDVPDTNVGNNSNRTTQLSIFDFRLFINLADDKPEEYRL